ncbi:ISKra4 family transposase [Nonomuraea deserti]|uniref:ISKra4 family transposase n=1 Tax=Nonomuraea deserti TaxID=1848322 RepID=UPI00248266ED|nr:ISKra4 family transposase [Nonomuraea deserti]
MEATREEIAGRADRRAARVMVDAGGVAHRVIETGHERCLASVVGPVTVRRAAFRAGGTANLYPADARLNLPAGRHSHGLRKRAVVEAVRGSFDDAVTAIRRCCGNVVAKRQVERLVITAARDVEAFYEARVPLPCTAATLLVISCDGKGVPMRPEALRPATRRAAAVEGGNTYRTRLAGGEKSGRKRMATVAAVYDAEPAVRRPHDVITLSGSGTATKNGPGRRPGPKATGKWLTASVERSAEQVIADAFDQAAARDPQHRRRWVVLVDGDRHQLDLVHSQARRHQVDVHIVVDAIHVADYVWKAAWSLHTPGDPAAERWVAIQLLAILSGRLEETLAELRCQARTAGLSPEQRKGIETCAKYLTAKRGHLDYAGALAAGWPIATGIVEGACRHLVADRLNITGARWGLDGAEAVLKLRVVISNGHLEPYWTFHLQQEHHRIHQTRYQDGHQLTA